MENTLENKARFFAQYWGQSIVYVNHFHETPYEISTNHIFRGDYIELKPISSITDEDHKEILENEVYNTEKSVQKDKIGNYYTSDIAITDYLRSKGYALPYMDLSIEKQIEYGWVKIKS